MQKHLNNYIMKEYIGNLIIEENDKGDFSKLEKVTGDLYVNSNVTFEAPQLTSVGGDLYVYSNVTFEAPQLTSVGGYLSVNSNVTLPQLTSVGGYLSVNSNVTFEAPQLTSVGGDLYVNSNVTLNCKFLKGIKYKSVDGYLFIIESEKTSKGIKIYSGYNTKGVEKGKLIKRNTIYVAEKDNFFAHGNTVKKAIDDLQFKIVSEKLKKEPIEKDTLINIQHYRLITGACELGVKEWINNNNITSESILAKDLLPILEKTNAYGLEQFKKLITWED